MNRELEQFACTDELLARVRDAHLVVLRAIAAVPAHSPKWLDARASAARTYERHALRHLESLRRAAEKVTDAADSTTTTK